MTNTVPTSSGSPASYLSLEQQRRRSCASTLPLEHYELAVRHHQLVDPDTAAEIPCRVIFVYSTADAQVCQAHPDQGRGQDSCRSGPTGALRERRAAEYRRGFGGSAGHPVVRPTPCGRLFSLGTASVDPRGASPPCRRRRGDVAGRAIALSTTWMRRRPKRTPSTMVCQSW